jgi:hypothetical protein
MVRGSNHPEEPPYGRVSKDEPEILYRLGPFFGLPISVRSAASSFLTALAASRSILR